MHQILGFENQKRKPKQSQNKVEILKKTFEPKNCQNTHVNIAKRLMIESTFLSASEILPPNSKNDLVEGGPKMSF